MRHNATLESSHAQLIPLTRAIARFKRGRYSNKSSHTACAAQPTDEDIYPPKLARLISSFRMVPDPMLRYKQLLFLAKKLKTFPEDDRIDANKVPGCTSQVWITVEVEDGLVYIDADSDSQLTKGLAALLVEGLTGGSVQSVLNLPPDFIEDFGLNQSLTPSRTNGFLNMVSVIKGKIRAT